VLHLYVHTVFIACTQSVQCVPDDRGTTHGSYVGVICRKQKNLARNENVEHTCPILYIYIYIHGEGSTTPHVLSILFVHPHVVHLPVPCKNNLVPVPCYTIKEK
jgi:hypothetical protein